MIYVKRPFTKLLRRSRREKPKSRPTGHKRRYDNSMRPCIEAILRTGNIHSPDHKLKVAVVAELAADGWGVGKIIGAFSGMACFDRSKTTTQVKSAMKYSPFKCDTIESLGGCLYERCPIYRKRHKVKLPLIRGWAASWEGS